ncbi:hypothetical protein PAEPH01_1647 [Pancytospora epiphaga]|nr:hypothetical protein PAEPH01_1647 [Pancytospora epiphaga]
MSENNQRPSKTLPRGNKRDMNQDKINLLRVIIRLFNQFVPGRLELRPRPRPRAPALDWLVLGLVEALGAASIFEGYALQRLLKHDRLNLKLGYPDVLRVPSVVLCYHSVPCHHIRYDPRSAPVFLPKLVYNCTCASSLFPPLLVAPDS